MPVDQLPTAGPISLLPIAVTLVLALGLRNVIVGLFVGTCVGVAQLGLATGGAAALPVLLPSVILEHLVPQITDSYNAGVLVLLVFIGGFVALVEHSGGAGAFARIFARRLENRASVQLASWGAGIAIFFSDLGTPLIVGPVFRPLVDRLRISRQKLALILDATASPVAILIPFIGWGVYIMGLLRQAFDDLGSTVSDYAAFVAAIPFQFYAWLAITTVPLIAIAGRDWGPMASVEQRARAAFAADSARSMASPASLAADHPAARPSLIWLPLLAMALTLVALLGPDGFPFQPVPGAEFRAGLASAYLVAAAVLVLLSALQGVRRPMANVEIYLRGMGNMMSIAITLVLAWALADVGRMLGAPQYVTAVLTDHLSPTLLPALVFCVGGAISFATGSSWGTFAILIPLTIPAADALGAPLSVSIAAALSGGLFGDHSSPISETTILSATGADTPQYEHFRTQAPYAVANGALALLGFLLAGQRVSFWVLPALIVGQASIWFLLARETAADKSA